MRLNKIKKIVFISSYMKSGNTWMRSIICSLLNSGYFNLEDLKKIKLFSQESYFTDLKDKKFQANGNYDFNFVSNNWIKVQQIINEKTKDKIKFFKTHNIRGLINNNYFTDDTVCKGFIYLIRDPRDIVISLSKHMGISIDDAINILLFQKNFVTNVFKINEAVCTWDQHVKSWVNFKEVPRLIIRYEDMISNNKEIMEKIVEFLEIIYEQKLNIDKIIIKKAILNTSFDRLQSLEEKNGFVEATDNGSFFRKGIRGQWETKLNSKQIKIIEDNLSETMKNIGYL